MIAPVNPGCGVQKLRRSDCVSACMASDRLFDLGQNRLRRRETCVTGKLCLDRESGASGMEAPPDFMAPIVDSIDGSIDSVTVGQRNRQFGGREFKEVPFVTRGLLKSLATKTSYAVGIDFRMFCGDVFQGAD